MVRVNDDVGLERGNPGARSTTSFARCGRTKSPTIASAVGRGSTGLDDRIFGGQLLAQALVGAGATVDGKDAHSLHAAFVKAGTPGDRSRSRCRASRDGRIDGDP